LIFREILAEYAALLVGAEHTATDTGADFDEFVGRQRKFLSSPRADAARNHWRGELERLSDTGDLPTDRPRPAAHTFAGSEIDFVLPPDVVTGVEKAAAELNTTVFVYLLSVFQLLLHRFSGQTDFVIGYPATLRSNRRFRESIGYFVNLLPFRARVDPDGSFDALVRRTAEKTWKGLMHREYPFPLMPRLVDTQRDPARAGLISTMFVMTAGNPGDPLSALVLPGRRDDYAGLTVSEFYLPQQQGQFDLTMQVLQHGSAARAHLKYNTSLFTADTARGLTGEYLDLLRSATSSEI
jgi:non-ribosomal peptide synthetase component F